MKLALLPILLFSLCLGAEPQKKVAPKTVKTFTGTDKQRSDAMTAYFLDVFNTRENIPSDNSQTSFDNGDMVFCGVLLAKELRSNATPTTIKNAPQATAAAIAKFEATGIPKITIAPIDPKLLAPITTVKEIANLRSMQDAFTKALATATASITEEEETKKKAYDNSLVLLKKLLDTSTHRLSGASNGADEARWTRDYRALTPVFSEYVSSRNAWIIASVKAESYRQILAVIQERLDASFPEDKP